MDCFGSVKEVDFDEFVDFVYNVIDYLVIGMLEMQVSIVIFFSFYIEEFDFNDFMIKVDLLNVIKNLWGIRIIGKIYIYDVIDYVKDNFFMFVKGGRSGVNWMVVIFMDGFLNNFIFMVIVVDEFCVGLGVEVFVIGIGLMVFKLNDELKGIVSDFDFYYVYYIDIFVYFCNLILVLVLKFGIIYIYFLYLFRYNM